MNRFYKNFLYCEGMLMTWLTDYLGHLKEDISKSSILSFPLRNDFLIEEQRDIR